MGRDPKVGPVLFSIVKDEDYRGTNMRLILRSVDIELALVPLPYQILQPNITCLLSLMVTYVFEAVC
jgi:hypothetical protein